MELSNFKESVSHWMKEDLSVFNKTLQSNLKTQVCVIGGGIGGLTAAYLLQKEGKSVVLIDSSEIGSGQTGRTTAHFSYALDDRYFELEKMHGIENTRIAAESHKTAIAKVREIVKTLEIECDLEMLPGYLFGGDEKSMSILHQELAACHRIGLQEVKFLHELPSSLIRADVCLQFPDQMQLHPLKYLKGLAKAFQDLGGEIYTHAHAVQVQGGQQAFVLTKDQLRIECEDIVIATNTPFNDRFALHTQQAPYRTYAIGLRFPKLAEKKSLFWDTLDPYHYVRLQPEIDHDVLIVGGEDHKTGQNEGINPFQRYENLERWARDHFEMVGEVVSRWSGQVMEPVDGLAFLGRNPLDADNVFVISGDSGNGMTHTTIGAMLITDLIMQRENVWEKIYSPSRIKFNESFLKENLNVAAQYADWVKPLHEGDFHHLSPGSAGVFRQGLKTIAAHKDLSGNLHLNSAVCPHLGGIVRWNDAENSWDCPCHGSRFDYNGKVIEGPAFQDLKPIEEVERAQLDAGTESLIPGPA